MLGFILAVLAVVFGALGYTRARKGEATNSGMAIAGLVLGIIAFVVQLVIFAVVGTAAHQVNNDLQGITGHDPGALSDIAVSDCSISSEYGTELSHATVKITNSTPKAQLYTATIGVNSPDGSRLGEINVVSNSLGAGQSVVLSGMNATGTVTPGAKPGPRRAPWRTLTASLAPDLHHRRDAMVPAHPHPRSDQRVLGRDSGALMVWFFDTTTDVVVPHR